MIKTRVKQWGNSVGIVIPREDVDRMNLKLGEFIIVDIQRKEGVLRELFGSMKFGNSRKLLKESRKDMESKWM